MVTKNKIPFINENKNLISAIKVITSKKLGVLIATNKKGFTKGIFTDGNVRKIRLKKNDLNKTLIKNVMTKKPVSVQNDTRAVKALRIMNEKIISLCSYKKRYNKTVGLIHIHHLQSQILNNEIQNLVTIFWH